MEAKFQTGRPQEPISTGFGTQPGAVANLPFGRQTKEEKEGQPESNRDLERDHIPKQNRPSAQILEKMVELRGIEPLTFRLPVPKRDHTTTSEHQRAIVKNAWNYRQLRPILL